MNYIIDRENNLYIIKIGKTINDKVFQKVINEIIDIRNLKDKLYVYYTYFNKDATYCILDFNKRKLTDEDVNNIVDKKVMSL